MRIARFALSCAALSAGACVATWDALPAGADVSWEHSVTVRVTGAPVPAMKAKMFNNWTAQRHRLLLKYSVPSQLMQNEPGGAAAATTAYKTDYNITGAAGVIQRLDNDRILAYSSDNKSYVEEPRLELLQKLRIDPWKNLAPQLSKEAPPSLTPEQRERLGAEVRALYKPFAREYVRTYFRPLPQSRVLNGYEARGYRMTMLLNSSTAMTENNWVRVSYEWWLAPQLPGDEVVSQFQQQALETFRDQPWPTTSMWLNEMYPVLWEMLPEELHQAASTLNWPPQANAAMQSPSLPLRFYATVEAPQQDYAGAAVRAEVALTDYSTRSLPETVWSAPENYKQLTGEDLQKQLGDAMQSGPMSDILQGASGYGQMLMMPALRAFSGGLTP